MALILFVKKKNKQTKKSPKPKQASKQTKSNMKNLVKLIVILNFWFSNELKIILGNRANSSIKINNLHQN